jgi:hypothetical protein
MFVIYAYPQIKRVDTYKLFTHIDVEHTELGNLSFLDPEVEIMQQYHILYSPFPDQWEKAIMLEDEMFGIITTRYLGGKTVAEGAAPLKGSMKSAHVLKKTIYDGLATSDMGILVGHWAYYTITLHGGQGGQGGSEPLGEKVQIVIHPDTTPESIGEKLDNILRDKTNFKVSWRTEDAFIPHDYWLKRTTYYLTFESGDKSRVPILDTFNSQDYELVPFHIVGGIKIGNAYTICRFFMVDKWILNVLEAMGLVPQQIAKTKIISMYRKINVLRKMSDLIFGDQYDGIFRDLTAEKRKLIKEQEKYSPYVPYMYELRNQRLRVL